MEIEIPDIVEWKKDVYRSENEHYCIKNDGNFTILVCKVEILVEHWVCVFRIGSSIVTLEMEGVPYPKGTFVEIRSQNLILYNINL
ncbi:hypothetical protein [Cytobacillus horneckiae]|uniref:hypothetical protein n=1 Tax=Cytobacillus horneckiae TaxID=549687 RepID=UPI003D9A8ED5